MKWDLRDLTYATITGSEADRMRAAQSPALVHLVNRENLARLAARYVGRGKRWPYDCVVVDESGSFKSRDSPALAGAALGPQVNPSADPADRHPGQQQPCRPMGADGPDDGGQRLPDDHRVPPPRVPEDVGAPMAAEGRRSQALDRGAGGRRRAVDAGPPTG